MIWGELVARQLGDLLCRLGSPVFDARKIGQ